MTGVQTCALPIYFINKDGTIKCTPLGGHNPTALGAQRAVLIKKDHSIINGSINVLPPHLNADNVEIKISDLLFDFGYKNENEALADGVYIGAPIVLKGELESLNNGQRLLSKAFDDRYGITLIADILDKVMKTNYPFDLYLGGTVLTSPSAFRSTTNVISPISRTLCTAPFIFTVFPT